MTSTADFLIIGGGIAGLSAASRLLRHGKVVVLEAEEALGYHSSGRSVSFSHYGIGNSAVRRLTAWSRPFFEDPPEGFSPTPLARNVPSLYFAAEETLPDLAALEAEMARFTDRTRRIDAAAMAALCPALRTGAGAAVAGVLDPTGLKLDADALLQACARAVRAGGGEVLNGRRIVSIGEAKAGASAPRAASNGRRRSWSTPPEPGPTGSPASPGSRRSASSPSDGRSSSSTRRQAPTFPPGPSPTA
jgi:D-arginine dehydrogenase